MLYYKGLLKKKPHPRFVLWIYQLPRGKKIPFCTFFNSPIRVDSQNIHFFNIWWNIDWDIGQTISRGYIKAFFVYFWIKHLSTQEPQWALMRAQDHWWDSGIKLLSVSVHTSAHGHSWVYMSALWGSLVLKCLIQK